ncbi:cyclin B1 interacting protein 1 [Exophiala viscosa]|uniref:Cyclin B1 interacting protein 1 n=1 Tax=Exophiala viscosa TaxID=2486360 RepID=A0AAN6E0Y6_9EURO|nr:cyclin B1 interacting protein 1 [Exophiala viscosa]KAI1624054.1 cyclin B1 interacting protein 1 [Exophiala viscosa]
MEHQLTCNNQHGGPCRAILKREAVVTTCSHIFCLPCTQNTGLADAPLDRRRCPACNSTLPNQDDAVKTRLDPSEEYKTSVLSGLDPSTVLECAGRAVAFWSYQVTHEIAYQQFVAKNLTEKYTHLSSTMDKVVHEANTEIQAMQKKLGDSTAELQGLQQKHDELADYYREKSRKLAQMQKLYNALKQRAQAAEMIAPAASKDVEQTLQSIASVRRPDAGFAKPAPRPEIQPTVRPSLSERGNRPLDVGYGGVEPLHPHQRSGSSAMAAAQRGMPSTATLPAKLATVGISGTPLHRATLPGQARAAVNRSQLPVTAGRTQFTHEQRIPGSARPQPIHNSKVPVSTNYTGLLQGIKISRPGTAGSGDMHPKFDSNTSKFYQMVQH